MRLKCLIAAAALLMAPALASAQKGSAQEDGHRHPPAPSTAAVDFGVLPVGPIGPPPCLQSGAIGGPDDP